MIGFDTQHDQNALEYPPLHFVPLSVSNNPGLVPTKIVCCLTDSSVYEGQKKAKQKFSGRIMSS